MLCGQGTFYGEGMSGAQDLGRVQRHKSAWVSWGQAGSDQTGKTELPRQARGAGGGHVLQITLEAVKRGHWSI